MSYDTALIKCVETPNLVFPQTKKGDIVFYPLNKSQKIMIGTETNKTSAITIDKNNVGISTDRPKASLHVKGNTKCEGDLELSKNSTRFIDSDINMVKDVKLNQVIVQGGLSCEKKYHGVRIHQIADTNHLNVDESHLTPTEALNLVNNIPVHDLSEKHTGINDPSDYKKSLGCIADDLSILYPPCVSEFYNIKTVDYSKLVPVLIKAIQGLNAKYHNNV